jgi:hypothetical protein
LLDGTEDVLVPLALGTESGGYIQHTLLNPWLEQAPDEEILAALDEWYTTFLQCVLPFYLERNDDLADEAEHDWIEGSVNDRHIRSWTARHRPHLAEQITAQPVDHTV